MSLLGNLIWLIFGGLISALLWMVAGALLCLTVIGIPFGMQCFKIAGFVLAPFGRSLELGDCGPLGCLGNLLWLLLCGWELCLAHAASGLVLCCTIVGIPFGMQHFKLAMLSLFPFGASSNSG